MNTCPKWWHRHGRIIKVETSHLTQRRNTHWLANGLACVQLNEHEHADMHSEATKTFTSIDNVLYCFIRRRQGIENDCSHSIKYRLLWRKYLPQCVVGGWACRHPMYIYGYVDTWCADADKYGNVERRLAGPNTVRMDLLRQPPIYNLYIYIHYTV